MIAAPSPADLAIHESSAGEGRKEAPRRWTIVATVLAHALVLALFILDWQWRPLPAPAPKPIPVQLVMLPPKPEPVPEPPLPSPKPQPLRESGPDQETTAPPPAEAEGPKAAPPPAAQPPVEEKPPGAEPAVEDKPPEPAPTVEEKPPEQPPPPHAVPERAAPVGSAKPQPKKEPIHTEAPKQAPVPMEPRIVSLSPPGRAPSDLAKSGDRYLNNLRNLIERNRSYPPAELFHSRLGLTAVYQVVVDRSGNLMGVNIVQSTGISKLDQVAGLMIRDAAPFPPLPPQYPDARALITIVIPVFPAPQ